MKALNKLDKKGQAGGLDRFVLSIVVVVFVLVIGIVATQELRDSTTAGTQAYNTSDTLITKLGTGSTWIGLIIVVGFAVAVIGFFRFLRA